MDVYTTSFTYPRRLRHSHSPASSLDFQSDIRNTSLTDSFTTTPQQKISDVSVTSDTEAIQKLAMMAMSLHGCHVSYFMVDQGKGWNFHITGAYQQVMITRGLILKECPIQVSFLSYRSIYYSALINSSAPGRNQSDSVRDPRLSLLEAYLKT